MSPGAAERNVKRPLDENECRQDEAEDAPPLRNYLAFTIFTCFCPAYPINIVALIFSVLSQNSHAEGDYEGSRQLGRKALHLGITSIVIGLLLLATCCIIHFTSHET